MKKLTILLILVMFVGCANRENHIVVENRAQSSVDTLSVDEYNEKFIDEDSEFTNGYEASEEPSSRAKQEKKRVERLPSFGAEDIQDFKIASNTIKKPKIIVKGNNVKVNIESIPLNEFIDFIFSSVLKLNYSVDKKVKALKQPINLNMSESISKQALLNVVEKLLEKESVTLTKENETIFIALSSSQKIKDDLSNKYIFFGRKIPTHIKDDKKVMVFVPYYYTAPKSSFKILKRLGAGHVYFSYIKGNIQILDGKAKDVRQTLEMISVIDSLNIEKKEPYLIELENVEVEKFKSSLVNILKSNSIPIANTINDVGIVLTEIKELNGLLILTPKQSWLDRVLFWKDKLDVISQSDTEHSRLYSYKVKYRKVDELAGVLSDILSSIDSNIENNKTILAPSLPKVSTKIKADLYTNRLMINTTSSQYKELLPIIKKLDTLPLQVLLEVTLAEVTMTDTFSLGFEWALLNNKAITGTPLKVSGAHTLGFGGKGISSNLFTTNLTSLINSFAEQKKLEILSRPRLIILNNKTGNINVGKQVPVVSSEASAQDLGATANSSILRNITYITTGTSVGLTPTINSNGSLTLDINIQLSEAQTNKTSNIDSPLIVNRSLTTSAVMQSGATILLGGMISHNNSNGHGGVPILKDIPWLGNIFKSQSENHVKTELIILITPKILKNNNDSYEETRKFKILLKNLRDSIKL